MRSMNVNMKITEAKTAVQENGSRTPLLFVFLLLAIFSADLFAQAPQAFKYQAVARNAGGDPIQNTSVSVQFQLHHTSPSGTVVYAETHSSTTDERGLFSVQVGNGAPSIGSLATVDWSNGPYFLEVGLDPSGGSSYIPMGNEQVMSVPYALSSGAYGSWQANGADISNTNSGRVGIGTATPGLVANTNAKVEIADEDGSNGDLLLRTAGFGAPVIALASQNGTLDAPASVDPDAEVGALESVYRNNTDYGVSGRIVMWADGTSNGTDHPGSIEFRTTPVGSSTPVTRMMISDSGRVGIGTTTPERLLDVNGDARINGLTVGRGNGDEPTNSALGMDVLESNTTGVDNTAVGSYAMNANTLGYSNAALGASTLSSNTGGHSNTAGGNVALFSNSTGSNNTAFGEATLFNGSTSSWNTAIGSGAAFVHSGADIITAVGAYALFNATNGPNTALGYNAGNQTTSGTHNVAVGRDALYNNTTGSYNTTIGYGALNGNTTGSGNTAIGYDAYFLASDLNNSTAIGHQARVATSNALVLGRTDVSVGIGTTRPEVSAVLELKSTTQGFLPPRMTGAQRDGIVSPESGLIIWCTDCGNSGAMQMYFGPGNWRTVTGTPTVPTVVTDSVASFGLTGAKANIHANITSSGGSYVYVSGVCWSTAAGPTIALSTKTIDGNRSGTFASTIRGLNANTTYYVRAYATNLIGTFYGNEVSFTTTDHQIGDPFQGGILAYRLQPGDPGYDVNVPHGGIVAPMAQSTGGAPWGCYGTTIATIGSGQQNTTAILNAGCSNASDAVRLCSDLDLNGYDDWYLPSIDEFSKLFDNYTFLQPYLDLSSLSFIAPNAHWTSTQIPGNNGQIAILAIFPCAPPCVPQFDPYPTTESFNVRAFRSF